MSGLGLLPPPVIPLVADGVVRVPGVDGVAQDDADALLSKLAALSVSAALFVTVDGEETASARGDG